MRNGKKCIAHVVYSFASIGGLENGVINLCNNLDSSRFVHIVISLTELGTIRKRVVASNVKYFSLNKAEGNDVTLPFKLARIFKKEKIDTVHLRNWATMVEGYVASKLAGVKNIIYSEHGRHFEDVWEKKKFVTVIHRFILNHVDIPLCVSGAVAKEMHNLYTMNQDVKVIINGVDTEKFKPLEKKICRSRVKLALDVPIIGSVGRLVHGKNYDQLIEDFLSHFKTGILVIVGDGPEKENLQHLVRDAKGEHQIKLMGHSDNVCELLNCFDLFVLPSASEGLSNVLLEAMSCALPVVAYDVGGNPELIDQDKGGILVPLGKRDTLLQAVDRVLKNNKLLEDFGRYNHQKVIEQLSLDHMVEAYSDMYSSCSGKCWYGG